MLCIKSPRKGGKGTFSDVLGCLQTNHLNSKNKKRINMEIHIFFKQNDNEARKKELFYKLGISLKLSTIII